MHGTLRGSHKRERKSIKDSVISFFQRENGQNLVEFALVLPILLLLVCGIIEFGMLLFTQINLEHCAREGVRYAAVHASDWSVYSDVENRVDGQLAPLADDADVDVIYTTPWNRRTGDVTVIVSADYMPLTPVGFMLFGSDGIELRGTLTMKVE